MDMREKILVFLSFLLSTNDTFELVEIMNNEVVVSSRQIAEYF